MENRELLRYSRKKLGWTQQDLADYFGINQRVIISYWERGERPIPDEVLKVAKRVKRMNKKTARSQFKLSYTSHKNRDKSVTFSPDKKTHVAQGVSNSNLLHSLEGKITPEAPVADFSGKFPENSMERYILDAYITFKRSTGRFPTAEDFVNRTFKEIARKEVLEYFGSLSKAKKFAGELMRCQRRGYGKKEQAHTLEAIEPRKNNQTAITYIDPNDKYNWLKALYPGRNFDTYKSKVKARSFTWEELFKHRPESERLVPQISGDES